jgi:O-succinylbenzoate synthase
MQDACRKRDIPVWCGGMLESGIGCAHNIAMSTLAGFYLPGNISASEGDWSEDIIDPEVEVTARGTIEVPKNPGIGYSGEARPRGKANRQTKRMGATH